MWATPSESTGHSQSLQRGVGLHARWFCRGFLPLPRRLLGGAHTPGGLSVTSSSSGTAFVIADEASKALDDTLQIGHRLELHRIEERNQLLFASITGGEQLLVQRPLVVLTSKTLVVE